MHFLFVAIALLVLIAGLVLRRDRRRDGALSDAQIREIEATGLIDREDVEPLDVEEIRTEEDEFWEQTWDEPEDWRG